MREVIFEMDDQSFEFFLEQDPDHQLPEIVRCKDCRHATKCKDGHTICKQFGYKPEDFYCAFGKRRIAVNEDLPFTDI